MKKITIEQDNGTIISYSSNIKNDPNFEKLQENYNEHNITIDENSSDNQLDPLFKSFNEIFGNPDLFSFFGGGLKENEKPKEDNIEDVKKYFGNCGAIHLEQDTMIYNVPFSNTYFLFNIDDRMLFQGINGEGIVEKNGVYIETVEQLSNIINE